MLNRYCVDVSALTNDEKADLKRELNKFAFEVFDRAPNGQLLTTMFDVFLDEKYSFDQLFSLPPGCSARRID